MDEHASDGRVVSTIVSFIREIGLLVIEGQVQDPTFLPGILVDHGTLRFDGGKLQYPGDLLHEAGHLAVMPPERRRRAHVTVGKDGGEEMAAIAWSWAALVHLKMDPGVVFHSAGYHGGGQAIVENFAAGRYFGVPFLQWRGLTFEPRQAKRLGVEPFPTMLKWLCDDE